MSSYTHNDANNGMENLNALEEDQEIVKKLHTAGKLREMQPSEETTLEKLTTSSLTTPSKVASAEKRYPSPPQSVNTNSYSAACKKRVAEDELSSSPKKGSMIRPIRQEMDRNFKSYVSEQVLQNQIAIEIKIKNSKKRELYGDSSEHLPCIDPLRPLSCKIDPKDFWDEKSFNLAHYPRLVTTKLAYRYPKVKNPWNDVWEYVCFPIAPADDIKKSLHLGRTTKHLKWTGVWAEQKLQKEIAKYERIKEFWLFNYAMSSVVPFFPGLDKKEEFCVGLFSKELQSPWVCAWLRELLGDKVMDAMEVVMSSANEGQWKTASDSVLCHQGNWESLCLRFKCRASSV